MLLILKTQIQAMQYQNPYTPKERAEIDAALAEMANDSDYQTEVLKIEAEFALAQWEALEIGETLYQPDNGWERAVKSEDC